jgi:uncharacterized membrane protein YjfL (UPF0719 family)
MDFLTVDYAPLALAFTHVIAGVLVLIAAKFVKDWLTPYSVDQELTSHDNPAFGLAVSGYYSGVVIVYLGAASIGPLPLDGGTAGVLMVLGTDVAWALGGVLALNVSREAVDRAMVVGTRCSAEVIGNRNVAAGALECGSYIAAALVLAGAVHQPGGTVLSVAVLFGLGLVALILVGRVYQKFAGYDVAREICGANLAAGVAFGMTLIAIALVMMKATSGEFIGWARTLTFFAFDAVAGLVLLLVLRWVADMVLLPNARIADEIVRDRNVNVGLVEGVVAVGIGSIILFLF